MVWNKLDQYPRIKSWIERNLQDVGYDYKDKEGLQSTLRSFGVGKGADGWIGMLIGSQIPLEEYKKRNKGKSPTWQGLFAEEDEQLRNLAKMSNLMNTLPEVDSIDRLDQIERDTEAIKLEVSEIFPSDEIDSLIEAKRVELWQEDLSSIDFDERDIIQTPDFTGTAVDIPYEVPRTKRVISIEVDKQDILTSKFGPYWRNLTAGQIQSNLDMIGKLTKKGDTEGLRIFSEPVSDQFRPRRK